MKFEVVQILDRIKELYKLPRNKQRFDKYLFMLQGSSKDDLLLPIAGYNPMGKELAVTKLDELIQLNAEEIAKAEVEKINQSINSNVDRTIQVVINLVDDVEGSWSNPATTDYSSKFEIEPLIKRNFCTPYFWTSEDYSEKLIARRIREYVFRTIHRIKNGIPKTLKQAFEQEAFVQSMVMDPKEHATIHDFSKIEKFYIEHKNSDDYNLKFCFFYGDRDAESLAYPTFDIRENEGFDYVKFLVSQRQLMQNKARRN